MTRTSSSPAAGRAVVAALTTWVAVLAWRGFTEDVQRYLVPVALLGAVVAGTGVLLRWWRAPGPVVLLVQLVVSGLVAAAMVSGSALPVGAGYDALRRAFVAAQQTAETYAPPVPAEVVPGVHPYLVVGGLACLLLVDLLACTVRRAPLAGLPLLAVFSLPVGMLGISMAWWVFVLAAVGFLTLLLLEQRERVWLWGRTLDGSRPRVGGRGTAVATGAQAGAIGGGVTVLAVVLPLVIPTLSIQLLDIGRGPGGDDDISVVNPTTDLRRDLQQRADVPLVTVRTDDPDPDYLRIAVLNRFSGEEWSSGDRDIPTDQVARGQQLPPLQGVFPAVARTPYAYRMQASDDFESTWLPTMASATTVTADGDWRFDTATTDFIAADDDLSTAGLTWSSDAVDLALDATALDRAGPAGRQVDPSFVDLPDDVDSVVRNLANQVTRDAVSPYAKARALQSWFRESGGFTYDLSVQLGTGEDDLVAFLRPGPGGRTGYCEQFASAMAVMARALGIPARVAVGFLEPTRIDAQLWQYSSHDLHAWPEVFIPGGGWVRFEPTPAARAETVPAYTAQAVAPVDPVVPDATEGPAPDEQLPRDAQSAAPTTPDAAERGGQEAGSSVADRWPWLVVAASVLLLAAALATPGLLRRRRRERRRADGGVEAAWAELADTARDLAQPWPAGRSPRETAAALASPWAGSDGRDALDRLVGRVERRRFAAPVPGAPDAAGVRADLDEVLAVMTAAATPAVRRRAAVLPRSALRRAAPVVAPDGADTGGERLLEHA